MDVMKLDSTAFYLDWARQVGAQCADAVAADVIHEYREEPLSPSEIERVAKQVVAHKKHYFKDFGKGGWLVFDHKGCVVSGPYRTQKEAHEEREPGWRVDYGPSTEALINAAEKAALARIKRRLKEAGLLLKGD